MRGKHSQKHIKKRIEPLDLEAADILARTIWGEARGEKLHGQEAVASTIMNRVAKAKARGGHWWGNDVISVCKKPYQFSCWNLDDPNLPKLLGLSTEDKGYQMALRIAKRALRGNLVDRTNGATHYHTVTSNPWWAKGRVPSCQIGAHKFYRNIG